VSLITTSPSSDINFSCKEQQFNLNLLSDDGLLLIIDVKYKKAAFSCAD